jgi:DNA-binding NarL/FixJ family response regulator
MATQTGTPTPDPAIRVVIFDQHESTRLGSALLLQRQPWVERCLLAGTRDQAVRLIARHRPRVAVVDISNLGPFVSSVTDALREADPHLELVLTARCSASGRVPLGAVGAAGYLGPGTTGEELVELVRATAVGSAPLVEDEPIADETARHLPTLNSREREVLDLLATGATNVEIAEQLHLSRESIKKHATSIYRKLGVRNRTEATRRAGDLLVGTR